MVHCKVVSIVLVFCYSSYPISLNENLKYTQNCSVFTKRLRFSLTGTKPVSKVGCGVRLSFVPPVFIA